MAQTQEGAMRIAAKKSGVTVQEYRERIQDMWKHCGLCRQWLAHSRFRKDTSRYDGLSPVCFACRNARDKAKRVRKPRVSKKGQRFVAARDGDKIQARARVNQLVKINLLPNPNDLPCFDCGHQGSNRRHEYDHSEGYSAEKQESVQAICSRCHAKRSRQRGELVQIRDENGKFKRKGESSL